MVIARTDRVSTVLAHDESLLDVFVSLSPAFQRLRSPGMRKVMTRLVTVEQAARMAGVDADELVAKLNAHDADVADVSHGMAASRDENSPAAPVPDTGAVPDGLARTPRENIVELDVRDELRAGREPFSLIMGALKSVPAGGALCVRAIFEPVPLYAVMKRQGLDHWTERLADDDWRVWFHPPRSSVAGSDDSASTAGGGEAGEAGNGGAGHDVTESEARTSSPAEADVVILDVRGLEPPEPMMRTMAALEQLPRGATLLQINVRTPQFLLPMLEERGFTYDVREQEPGLVRVFIRHSRQPGTGE